MATVLVHILTDYSANVQNRDDSGAPKTAVLGGVIRQRRSSQCIKNALRSSIMARPEFANRIGMRTRWIGQVVHDHLVAQGYDTTVATPIAIDLAEHYGAMAADKPLQSTTLTYLSPAEFDAAKTLAEEIASGKLVKPASKTDDGEPKKAKGKKAVNGFKPWLPLDRLMLDNNTAVDLASFGRMMASHKRHSVTGAMCFGHAFTTHRAQIDGDYFTGQDHVVGDSDDGAGAGHLDVQKFGSGVSYQYASIDTDRLVQNLSGDVQLAMAAALTVVNDLIHVTPSAKRGSFASDAYASYVLVEAGYDVARSLAGAFTVPVRSADQVAASIVALRGYRDNLASATLPWGQLSAECTMSATEASGTVADVLRTVAAAFKLERPVEQSLVARVMAEMAQ